MGDGRSRLRLRLSHDWCFILWSLTSAPAFLSWKLSRMRTRNARACSASLGVKARAKYGFRKVACAAKVFRNSASPLSVSRIFVHRRSPFTGSRERRPAMYEDPAHGQRRSAVPENLCRARHLPEAVLRTSLDAQGGGAGAGVPGTHPGQFPG